MYTFFPPTLANDCSSYPIPLSIEQRSRLLENLRINLLFTHARCETRRIRVHLLPTPVRVDQSNRVPSVATQHAANIPFRREEKKRETPEIFTVFFFPQLLLLFHTTFPGCLPRSPMLTGHKSDLRVAHGKNFFCLFYKCRLRKLYRYQ